MKLSNLQKTVLSAMFLAMGVVLPLFTAQIKEIGDTLLPMHFPVMLCGLICGPWYGLMVGFILPFFRSAIFSMPPMYPNAVWMAFELATYGGVIGLCYRKAPRQSIGSIYLSLVIAMVAGRIVWGLVKTTLLGLSGKTMTAQALITGGFLDAIPGIVLQLLLIPAMVRLIEQIYHHKE